MSQTMPESKEAANTRVIAIDFDDVCCQSMAAEHEGYNVLFGTNLKAENLESVHLHQNPGWGSIGETRKKQEAIGPVSHKTDPVPGFASALRHLHALGHPLHIVTARPEFTRPWVCEWLGRYGITVGSGQTDEIAAMWFTSAFARMNETEAESTEEGEEKSEAELKEAYKQSVGEGKGGKKKLKVLQSIGASLFIDDHYGNLEPAIQAIPQIPCLLFGKYGWNAYHSGAETPAELMSYDERTQQGLELPKRDIEMMAGLERVEGWDEVVKWVEAWDQTAVKSTKP